MPACIATVTRREEVAPLHYLLEVHCPEVAMAAQPGQFVHVRVAGTNDPLLRRPISIMSCDPKREEIQLLVHAVGRGTDIIGNLAVGSTLDLLGPLGNGFTLPEAGQRPLLIAGGVGVAPMIFLAEVMQFSSAIAYVRGMLGAATEDLLICWNEFSARCEEFIVTTDDGSAGIKGFVTAPLPEQLARGDVDCVYTCGPRPMMAAVAKICADASIPCQASLEQFMGCGIGACLGCVIPTYGTPKQQRVCKEGPVFDAQMVAWEEINRV